MFPSLVLLLLLIITSFTAVAQIPRVCSDTGSIANKTCCPTPTSVGNNPGACGINLGRGSCQPVSSKCHRYQSIRTDPRFNWPTHFFNNVCSCSGNYAGFDCGECKFGYTGTDCAQKKTLRTKTSINADSVKWNEYINTFKLAKTTQSRYVILHFDETIPPNQPITNYRIQEVSVYNLFAWMHHYVAKTNEDDYRPTGSANDYAHQSAGFLTWHRLFLLWFEREVQVTLNKPDFTLYFWDWTVPENRQSLFVDDKLGGRNDGTVTGNFGKSEWQTVCWFPENSQFKNKTCNITNPEGIRTLIRCPDETSCNRDSVYSWPTSATVTTMLSYSMFRDPSDQYPYNKFARHSFSNFLEGFIPETVDRSQGLPDQCNEKILTRYRNTNCKTINETTIAVTRTFHNLVHITLGIGFLKNSEIIGSNAGTMANQAASVNDPVFFNHHTMIDCLFEQWLLRHPAVTEYVGPDNAIFAGHNIDDCIVPFIPLYTHRDMFKRASEFGYSCDLSFSSSSTPTPSPTPARSSAIVTPTATGGTNPPGNNNGNS